jgi:hypothetical protein
MNDKNVDENSALNIFQITWTGAHSTKSGNSIVKFG